VNLPETSIEHAGDAGNVAHTNHLIFVPDRGGPGGGGGGSGSGGSSAASIVPSGENPSSLACVYNLVSQTTGCPTYSGQSQSSAPFVNASGGSGTIAIVDAYHYPNALTDLNTFSLTYKLPTMNSCTPTATSHNCFQVVYATFSGQAPSQNCGWNQEAALDIEWAHAMAPNANIVLVEAQSSTLGNLLSAVSKASTIVKNAGGGQVSMSWGSGEFSSETAYDSYFNTTGVTYVAAAGDSGATTSWPSVSASVISAGGTNVSRDGSGNIIESAWSYEQCGGGPCGGGGGPSLYVAKPSYQATAVPGNFRGTPDLSFDADPYSGVAVYDSVSCSGMVGWMVFGGTSVSTPALAGIFNLAGHKWGSGFGTTTSNPHYPEQTNLYAGYGTPSYYSNTTFRDVAIGNTSGSSDPLYQAITDWDYATGIGSSVGLNGK
jgi:subtilase family serine protease